jgi:hypothetical protein
MLLHGDGANEVESLDRRFSGTRALHISRSCTKRLTSVQHLEARVNALVEKAEEEGRNIAERESSCPCYDALAAERAFE